MSSFSSSYAFKRFAGKIFANAQSIRWPTQGNLLRQAANEFRKPGQKALDVGCGGGTYAIENHLLHGTPTMLCDYAGDLLALTRRQVESLGQVVPAEFAECSAEELPFPDAHYDFIQCMEVLEHLHHPEKAVAEFYRVAKPGARLVVSVPHPPEWFPNDGHVVEGYRGEEMSRLLENAGWRVIRVDYCMLLLTRGVIALMQLLRIPLPFVPLVWLENFVPRSWRHACLPYDLVVVAERPS